MAKEELSKLTQHRETLTVQRNQPHVIEVTLDRPEVANALNTQMGEELLAIFTQLNSGESEIRAAIITGSGDRFFCAGGDLKQREGMTVEQWTAQHLIFEQMVRAIIASRVPVIAAINGLAFGGGLEIALCCDIIHAADHAKFALPEVKLGIMPGCGGTQNLARSIGIRRALELMLTGTSFTAGEALDWGMVNSVQPLADLLPHARKTAAAIAGNAPLSTQAIRRSVRSGVDLDLHSAMEVELDSYNQLIITQDRIEGINAFNEKRAPIFTGK